jgi:hypothetical protein
MTQCTLLWFRGGRQTRIGLGLLYVIASSQCYNPVTWGYGLGFRAGQEMTWQQEYYDNCTLGRTRPAGHRRP